MNNLSDFANFGELQFFGGSGEGRRGRGRLGGAPDGSLRPGRRKLSLRLWYHMLVVYG